MSPLDPSTAETFQFVRRSLPSPPSRLLEVGCGRGDLALRLRRAGYDVVGVELSADDARVARSLGLDVRQTDFLEFEDKPFDAVLFTRSLHHIAHLPEALARSRALLRPNGTFIADEFDVEHVDSRTAAWFYRVQALLAAAGALVVEPEPGPDDPLARWERDHRHEPPLHTGQAMLAAVFRGFERLRVARTCYLYRTFCGRLRDDGQGRFLAGETLSAEKILVRDGRLRPVGLRLVASHRSPL